MHFLHIYIYIYLDVRFLFTLRIYIQIYTYINIYYLHINAQLFFTRLCSIYTAPLLPIYSIHPAYIAYTCVIVYLYATHCIGCPYTIYVYTPCKLPQCSLYTPYKLDINHLKLHKHCPCRTVIAGNPPNPQGGRGEPSGLGGVVIP